MYKATEATVAAHVNQTRCLTVYSNVSRLYRLLCLLQPNTNKTFDLMVDELYIYIVDKKR
jgi:hypothetical protein